MQHKLGEAIETERADREPERSIGWVLQSHVCVEKGLNFHLIAILKKKHRTVSTRNDMTDFYFLKFCSGHVKQIL